MYFYLLHALILLLLPIFPFSLFTNKFLSMLGAKMISFSILLFFICGNILLLKFKIDSAILEFLTVFTILFYSFRLLGVNNLKLFIMYLYPIISSFALLWSFVDGDIIEFMAVKTPVMLAFLALYGFLSTRFVVVHKKSTYGLGSVMPRFSILFVLSILGISSSMFFLGYEMLEIEITRLPVVYGVSLVVSWIFVNWGSIKVIEWLIYGYPNKKMSYKDLSNWQMSLLIFSILLTAGFFVFYSLDGGLA